MMEEALFGRMVQPASHDVVPHVQVPATQTRPPARSLLPRPQRLEDGGSRRRSPSCAPGGDEGLTHSVIHLGDVVRLAMAAVPAATQDLPGQVEEVVAALRRLSEAQSVRMALTAQTVFLRRPEDRPRCARLLEEAFGSEMPVTQYVDQPPCSGAALAVEAWGIGGPGVTVTPHSSRAISVSCGGIRWIHCGGIESPAAVRNAHEQTRGVLGEFERELEGAGAGWEDVVRTWFYVGDITGNEARGERYQEFNRARSEAFEGVAFGRRLTPGRNGHRLYPASTGIGMAGRRLAAGFLALQTRGAGARLVPLENPGQTPAYGYAPRYSLHPPCFSRAMAVLLGDYATTWISGTASIVNSESVFPGDIERQTHQALDNIERLIAPGNFARHGAPRAGATLADLAKVRVYVKRPEDYARCRAVCEQRLGAVPAIYAIADICRPELLVEIEGVTFSPLSPPSAGPGEVPE